MRRRLSVLLAAATVAAATGCAASSHAGGPSRAGPTLAVVADTVRPAPAVPSVPAPAARPPRFGKSFTYAAGLSVRVSRPDRFTPSPWVEPRPGTPLSFEVVVRNDTGDEWNPSQLHVRLTSGFQPAVQIYDAEKGIVARPDPRVPDGETVRFTVGYWVPDRHQLSLELLPGFGYASTVVTR